MAYLLDTNTISELVRYPDGRVARKVREVGSGSVCTSIIVVGELRYGVVRRDSVRLAHQVEEVLDGIQILPLRPPADAIYGRIRTDLERAGTPIGSLDLLIAAHALAGGHTLVTDNESEFRRIDDLPVENWLRNS